MRTLVALEARPSCNLGRCRAFSFVRYVDEQVFRYNNRKGMDNSQRFALAMSLLCGR